MFGSLLEWFKFYLSDRTQHVVVKGFKSKTYTVTSEEHQGSHLGSFADDLKLYETIKDCRLLLVALPDWCTINNMVFNTDKRYFITFIRNHDII